jgi:hypothetical protein
MKPWDMVGQIADVVLGQAPDRARPSPGEPAQFAGTYAGGSQANRLTVTVSGGELAVTGIDGAGATAEHLKFYGNDIFGVKDTLLIFQRENGRVSRLHLDKFGVHAVLARQ